MTPTPTAFPPPRASTDEHNVPLRAEQSQMAETDRSTIPGDEHLDKNAFNHPATYQDYDTVWIPQDPAGLYRDELEATQAAGVDVSSEGATMNEKGKVDISRAPPGEDWDSSQQI